MSQSAPSQPPPSQPSPDNDGENLRAALAAVGSYLSATLAATLTVLGLAVTLLSSEATDAADVWRFDWGVGLLAFSFLCALAGLGRQIHLLTLSDLRPYEGWLVAFVGFHLIALAVGSVLLALFAFQNLGATPGGGSSGTADCVLPHYPSNAPAVPVPRHVPSHHP